MGTSFVKIYETKYRPMNNVKIFDETALNTTCDGERS